MEVGGDVGWRKKKRIKINNGLSVSNGFLSTDLTGSEVTKVLIKYSWLQ